MHWILSFQQVLCQILKPMKDDYYYNSTLAHCVYYGVSTIPAAEKHLHGEIVSFGVLCLLTYDGQIRERDKIMAFNADMRLPVTLEEMDLTTEDVDKIVKKDRVAVRTGRCIRGKI